MSLLAGKMIGIGMGAIFLVGNIAYVHAADTSAAPVFNIANPVSTGTPDGQPMSGALKKKRLFWAEPVTQEKTVPHVASDEMKLVAVHGTVSLTTPDGQTMAGANGMIVTSGTKVTTSAASSAAVFMGGVNSARLVPDSGVVVGQTMEGTVRHTTIDLQSGAVFSRVGKRAGETQNYEVRTPEGVAAARGTEPMDALVHILVDGVDHTVHAVYVKKGEMWLYINGKLVGTIIGGEGKVGMASLGEPKLTQDQLEKRLDEVLGELQPFNVTTIQALFDYERGGASAEEVALIQNQLFGSIPSDTSGFSIQDQVALATVPVGLHDLLPDSTRLKPFSTPPDEATSSTDQ